jgi:hypothetical protein
MSNVKCLFVRSTEELSSRNFQLYADNDFLNELWKEDRQEESSHFYMISPNYYAVDIIAYKMDFYPHFFHHILIENKMLDTSWLIYTKFKDDEW